MRVGSLFSGIGGMDLGFEVAGGYEIAWQVEKDAWCRRVLAKHWPDVPRYEDVTTLTGEELEPVDLICGGFPCQPVSHAGQQKGTDDDRWLWPHFARLLSVLRPRYALVENVPGLFTANDGRAFGEVVGDLAALGYDCEWHVISAADVGAPHLRKRVWIVAHCSGGRRSDDEVQARRDAARGCRETLAHTGHSGIHQRRGRGDVEGEGEFTGGVVRDDLPRRESQQGETVADAEGAGLQRGGEWTERPGGTVARGHRHDVSHARRARLQGILEVGTTARTAGRGDREHRTGSGAGAVVADPTGTGREARCTDRLGTPDRPRRNQGQSPGADCAPRRVLVAPVEGEWAAEPDVGRVAHGVSKRVDRLRGLGNAVVPQVVAYLAVSIAAHAQEDA